LPIVELDSVGRSDQYLLPEFQAACRQARHAVLEAAVGRMQAVSGQLVETVIQVALRGRRDSDRTRASFGLLDRAHRGLPSADAVHSKSDDGAVSWEGTADSVSYLEARLQQVDQSDLPLAEKARLTALLSDALLRARQENEMAQRLEALEAVLRSRKETTP
jgi:hypothetical protein